jgi:hypothetical protein
MFRSHLGNHVPKRSRRRQECARSHSLRPNLEGLEDRTVLSFFTSPTFAVGSNPHGEAMGDFNGDGKADFAVVNEGSNTVSILLGRGDGTFRPKTDFTTGTTPWGLGVGDFNGDGKLDLAVANRGANSISILIGNGDGTLQPRTDIILPPTPVTLLPVVPLAVTVGDFNGDGKADLAVATQVFNTNDVTILLGNGNGTFQASVTTVTNGSTFAGFGLSGNGQSSIATADFNGDGHLDLVVVNNTDFRQPFGRGSFISSPGPGTVSVLLGNGDGTFQAPRNSAVGSEAMTVAVGDFNGDGRPDFAVNNLASNSLSVFTNSGGGNFSSSTILGVSGNLAAGDFNGDGITDLAAGGTVFKGQAGTGLQAPTTSYALTMSSPVTADLNGDGHLDLAGVTGTNLVGDWLNTGNGTFSAPILIPGGGVTLSSQATADFNGDGIRDLVTASTGQVQLGLGDGRFGDTTTLAFSSTGVAAVDADGNGTIDILVGPYATGQVAAWFNSPGYDNRTGGAVRFTVSAPTQVTAAANTSVTITAVDALGNPVTGFLGTVDLDSTPAGSTALNLAGQYTFTAADNGRHTFLFSNVTQAGAGTLSVFAVAMPGVTVPFTVVPAALNKLGLAAPASTPAGTPFSFTITALDKFGNVESGYTGVVHFSALANDTQAVLPADYTFTSADAGTHTFGATLFKTAGASSPFISAADLATRINTLATVNVTPLAPVSLNVLGFPTPDTAGTTVAVTVTAVDIYGNRATGYTGTIHFSSSDAQASLPSDYTFSAADGGQHTFPAALKTAGTQSFRVADNVNPAFATTQSGITVNPAAASVFAFTDVPASATAGTAQTFTITAMDAFGNRSPYLGLVFFGSSDTQASLPADYNFTLADAGSHTFTASLKTAGPQTIIAQDSSGAPPTGTQAITITPAATTSLQVTGFPATTAGVAHTFTVMARDAFGNVATGYTGTVLFASSDPIASLPANYTFTPADAGVHTFTAALKRAGAQFITVTDTLPTILAGIQSGIVVTPAAVTHFLISGPVSVTQGVGFKITVSAVDDFGNVNAGYRGAIHLSSTDATGGTQNFTFSNNDNGVHIFSYTFNALAFQTITIVDSANSSIAGTFVVDVLRKT